MMRTFEVGISTRAQARYGKPGHWLAGAAIAAILTGVTPAMAQDAGTDARLKKVEAEVHALQRKVFPGADGKYFEPEITAPAALPTPQPGTPSTTAVTDLLTRMDAVEAQLARLTGQVEQDSHRIGLLEAKLATQAAPPPGADGAGPMPSDGPPPGAPQGSSSAPPPADVPSAGPPPVAPAPAKAPSPPRIAPVGPSSDRVAAVAAVPHPRTSDAGEDAYTYGFNLWRAKFYPEAEQQLKLYLEQYPRHARASYGRNLLGRTYLDDGNPGEAAKWFLQNFQTDKHGDRAADSLLYLAVSMRQMKDDRRACIALSEFSETYAAEAAGRLSGLYSTTRSGLTCS